MRKHLVELLQRPVRETLDFVVFKVEVSELLQALEGEVDLLKLIVPKVEISESRKGAKHIVVFDFPDCN